MRRARLAAAWVLAIVLVAGVLILVEAFRSPPGYSPAQLTSERRAQVAQELVNGQLAPLYNEVQKRQPFSWTVAQEQVNEYLAAMEEIEVNMPGKGGKVRRFMDAAGLESPAVALDEGAATFMVRLRDYGIVLSARLAFDMTPERDLRVRLLEARTGRLTVPTALVSGWLGKLRGAVGSPAPETALAAAGPVIGRLSPADLGRTLASVVRAIDGTPVPTEIRKYRMRLAGLEIRDGQLTLRFEPTGAPK